MVAHITHTEFPLLIVMAAFAIGAGFTIGAHIIAKHFFRR